MKALSTIFAVVFVATAAALPTSTPTKALHQFENRAITCTNAATDNLIFAVSIGSFEKFRNAKDPSGCNWSSDNCSWSPEKPDGFNLIPSCHRHDFGHRNTKAQKPLTGEMKTRIDDNLKKDLHVTSTVPNSRASGPSRVWSAAASLTYTLPLCDSWASVKETSLDSHCEIIVIWALMNRPFVKVGGITVTVHV